MDVCYFKVGMENNSLSKVCVIVVQGFGPIRTTKKDFLSFFSLTLIKLNVQGPFHINLNGVA
jgi:hypothetical protein